MAADSMKNRQIITRLTEKIQKKAPGKRKTPIGARRKSPAQPQPLANATAGRPTPTDVSGLLVDTEWRLQTRP